MNDSGLVLVGKVAGVTGIALGVLLLIFRDVVARNVFAKLSQQQSFRLLRLITTLAWSVAVLGILGWIIGANSRVPVAGSEDPVKTPEVKAKDVQHRESASAPTTVAPVPPSNGVNIQGNQNSVSAGRDVNVGELNIGESASPK